MTEKKILAINTVLLLGVAALFFRVYLPLTEEIADLNTQLKNQEGQFTAIKQAITPKKGGKRSETHVTALPEVEIEQLGRQLENLALKHNASLVHIEADKDKSDSISSLKLKTIPYEIAFSAKDPKTLATLLEELETTFPELTLKKMHFEENMATLETILLVSQKNVRLFTP